jgi:uncharacterized protein (TIGR03067 family)
MSDKTPHSVIVQFLVQGIGTQEEFEHRVELQQLLSDALEATGNGHCSGGEGGSGTMNVFLTVRHSGTARQTILKTLEKAGFLDELVVAYSASHEEDVQDEYEVWWPKDYPYEFTIWGPMWKGPLPRSELRTLDDDLRSLQGHWKVVRYDAPDGSSSSEWSAKLRFLFVRDRLTVRHGIGIISDARIRLDASTRPNQIEMYPTIGPNKGLVSFGIYQLKGDMLQFCVVPPGEARPAAFAKEKEHQEGRMILHREPANESG